MFKSLLSRSPAISLALLLSWSLAVSQAFSSTTLDRALVVVNDEVVTQGEIEFVKRQLGQELEELQPRTYERIWSVIVSFCGRIWYVLRKWFYYLVAIVYIEEIN